MGDHAFEEHDELDGGDDYVISHPSIRAIATVLLWVCGDCGAHYPRSANPPELCNECGAPKEHFLAPVED